MKLHLLYISIYLLLLSLNLSGANLLQGENAQSPSATPNDPSLSFDLGSSPASSLNQNKKLIISGSFESIFEVYSKRKSSPFYKIAFYKTEEQASYMSLFEGDVSLNLDFVYNKAEFHFKSRTAYINPEDIHFDILEAVNRINFSTKLMSEIGVIRYAWGKGVFTNPTGFINPKKDPVETSKLFAGTPSVHIQFQTTPKSEALKNFAISLIAAFAPADINGELGKPEKTAYAAKIYFLFFDTDIDFMAYGGKEVPFRAGADISRNLGPAIEIHGEFVYYFNYIASYADASYNIKEDKINRFSALGGGKVVFPHDITLTLEYFYNGLGYNSSEYNNLQNYLNYSSATYNTSAALELEKLGSGTGGVFLKKHYFYANLVQTDFLAVKYLNVGASIILNLQDKSMVISPLISYSPFQNFELQVYFRFFTGKVKSEFGDNQNKYITGLKAKISF